MQPPDAASSKLPEEQSAQESMPAPVDLHEWLGLDGIWILACSANLGELVMLRVPASDHRMVSARSRTGVSTALPVHSGQALRDVLRRWRPCLGSSSGNADVGRTSLGGRRQPVYHSILSCGLLGPVTAGWVWSVQAVANLCQPVSRHPILRREPDNEGFPNLTGELLAVDDDRRQSSSCSILASDHFMTYKRRQHRYRLTNLGDSGLGEIGNASGSTVPAGSQGSYNCAPAIRISVRSAHHIAARPYRSEVVCDRREFQ